MSADEMYRRHIARALLGLSAKADAAARCGTLADWDFVNVPVEREGK
jgi:hypothetical protein